jgi:hypothetical protein
VSKNSAAARFRPGSATKHTAFWDVSSPVCGRYQLNANFLNTL